MLRIYLSVFCGILRASHTKEIISCLLTGILFSLLAVLLGTSIGKLIEQAMDDEEQRGKGRCGGVNQAGDKKRWQLLVRRVKKREMIIRPWAGCY